MKWVIDIAIVAALVWVGFMFVRAYRADPGTTWERVKAGVKNSATLAWSYFVLAAGSILDLAASLAGAIDESTAEKIKAVVPEYAAAVMVGVMVITILARLRSIVRDA